MSWLAKTHGVKFELIRHFFSRMLDGDWSGERGQFQQAAIGLVSLLLPAGLLMVREGSLNPLDASKYSILQRAGAVDALRAASLSDELTLITVLCCVTGLIALLEWQSLFPSGRDCLALASFPVRPRQLFAARFLTVMLFSTVLIAVLNLLPSLIAPAELGGGWKVDAEWFAQVAAQAAASGMACFFVFFAIVALQGLLLNLVPARWFVRVSASVQGLLVGVFLLGGIYSCNLKQWAPQRTPWLPPVWFTGLHESLACAADPFSVLMAKRALFAAAIAAALTIAGYLVSYRRYRKLLLESPARQAAWRSWPWSLPRLLGRSPQRVAILDFMAKTLARSRTHRVVWLAYVGVAIAIMLNSSLVDGAMFGRNFGVHAHSLSKALQFIVLFWPLACSMVLISGFRHVISIPSELGANWVFRLTESQGRAEWMSAVERFVIGYAVAPAYLLLFPVAVAELGWLIALAMTVLQVLVSLGIFELLFYSWQQLPFACSYQPGKRPMVIVIASYFAAICVAAPMLSVMISAAAETVGFLPGFYLFYLANFGLIWFFARRRRREGWGEARLLYEDLPQTVIGLGIKEMTYAGVQALQRDSARNVGYADPEDADSRRNARLRDRGVHPGHDRGRAASGGGSVVPGAASAGIAGPAGGGMGDFGEQPPREVLPADGGRTPATGRRGGAMDPHDRRHREDHGAGIGFLWGRLAARLAACGRLATGLLRPSSESPLETLSDGPPGRTARPPQAASLPYIFLRVRALLHRRQLDRDLEDELSFHVAMRAAKTGDEAAARRQFGNFTSFKETCRDMWTFTWLETFLQDLRYAVRQLRVHPGFTAVAGLTLGLGIGATTSIYSMLDTLMWRPMAWVQPEGMTILQQDVPGEHVGDSLTAADIEDIRHSVSSLGDLTVWNHATANLVDASGEPMRVEFCRVTPNFFDVVGVYPALGRAFQRGEDEPGRDHVTILSDDLWRRHFGADPSIAGRTIRFNGEDFTVVGVMPPKFRFPRNLRDLWIPLSLTPAERQSRTRMIGDPAGRLKPGRTLRQLAAELNTIGKRLEREHPDTNAGRRFSPWTLHRYQVGDYADVYVSMMLGAAIFVLLIACVNVANLQFARATGRWREVAVRTALGAGRSRILRQLVTESLVLGCGGLLIGLLFARWGLAAIKAGIPAEMRHYMTSWDEIGLNPRTFWFSFAAAVLSGLLSGLLPAWRCSRPNLIESLKEGTRSSGGPGRHRLRAILVAGEIALSVVLLVGAALMVRSFRGMISGQPNLHGGSLLTLRIELDDSTHHSTGAVAAFYRDLLDRLRNLPGVQSAGVVTAAPYSRSGASYPLTIEGEAPGRGAPPVVLTQSASPDYFRALEIPLRAGRLLRDSDTADAAPVVVISERMAHGWWPGEPFAGIVGKRIHLGPVARPWLTIAGICGDIHQSATERSMVPIAYVSYQQWPVRQMNVAIRASGSAMLQAPAVTAAIREIDREQPIENVATLDELMHQEIFVFSYMAWVMGTFGLLALTLAVVGVYGVMSYVISQQAHDIGVRIALGAPRRRVIGGLLRRGMVSTVIGLAAGMLPAFAMARVLAFAVWSVNAADAGTFLGIPFLLALAAGIAILIPARRAVGVDPIVALREE